MGRAESLEGKMSTHDPSDPWSRSDGEAELLQDLGWYHSNLTRHAAEALLLSNGCDGSYLLRDSNERTGLYSLSVRAKDSVKHFHVEYTGYSFKFGFNEFSSLKDFVKHFANQPLIGSETGTLIVLKHPYPRKVEEPSIYESVRVHTAMQTGRTENDLVPTAPSGFLFLPSLNEGNRQKTLAHLCNVCATAQFQDAWNLPCSPQSPFIFVLWAATRQNVLSTLSSLHYAQGSSVLFLRILRCETSGSVQMIKRATPK
nr:dual adapter for phosphotyrosine and 3-phosphotyrosine and 3-phosphoinositide isoform X2 [Vicugna pacos]